jgi:hypothetical protein
VGVLRENFDAGHAIVREQFRFISLTIEGVDMWKNMIPIQVYTHARMITVRETQDTISMTGAQIDLGDTAFPFFVILSESNRPTGMHLADYKLHTSRRHRL